MSLKYEKPLIVPFNTDEDETGLGLCESGQVFSQTGRCQATGNAAAGGCKGGNNPVGECTGGSGVGVS